MTYFSAVRLYSAIEAAIFLALIGAAIAGDRSLSQILGWTHGVGWIVLCALVYRGARRHVFPWWLVAATVTPLGPLGSTAGFEVLARRRPTHVP